MYAKDNPDLNVGNVETCIGKGAKSKPTSEKIFLFGDCAIEANEELKNSVKITGCPPKIGEYLPLLMSTTLKKSRVRKLMITRMAKMIGYKMGIYHENFGLWERYSSPEFEINHYR
jgi:hypothetical protein